VERGERKDLAGRVTRAFRYDADYATFLGKHCPAQEKQDSPEPAGAAPGGCLTALHQCSLVFIHDGYGKGTLNVTSFAEASDLFGWTRLASHSSLISASVSVGFAPQAALSILPVTRIALENREKIFIVETLLPFRHANNA
jgi:hypothetical protein